MRILLLGYGKMGQAIEQIALNRGHQISGKINIDNTEDLALINSSNTDVCIEFSQPESAFENIKLMLDKGIPVISGTTGWLERKPEIEQICIQKNGTFLTASNFSIGVNLFFKLNSLLAEIMKPYTAYDVRMEEIHHTQKKDAPSGTAITLAEGVLKNHPAKAKWVNHPSDKKEELIILSERIDEVPGTHSVNYTSAIDDIEIKHIAHNRQGFAQGAVLVAEWIKDKKGILTMNDFLKI